MGVVRGVSLPSPIDLTRRHYNTCDTCAVSWYFVLVRYTAVYRDLGDTGIVTYVSTIRLVWRYRGYRTTLLPDIYLYRKWACLIFVYKYLNLLKRKKF